VTAPGLAGFREQMLNYIEEQKGYRTGLHEGNQAFAAPNS